MRCHICGEFVRAKNINFHLKRRHKMYYESKQNYVWSVHMKAYGEERARNIVSFLFGKKSKGTISGLIISLVTLLIAGILVNIFYPIITSFTGDLDPSFQLMINVAFVLIFIGIIVEIILDATRGQQPQFQQI